MTEHEENHNSHEKHKEHFFSHSHAEKKETNNLVESIKQKLWDNRTIILLLIAIFLIAFGIRGHLLRYNYLFEFDAFYHARLVEDIVNQGFVSNPDPLAYYQEGGSIPQATSLYHVVSAFLYNIISFGQPFDKELFMWSIQFFPVVFGSIIAILMYFLTKEIFNNKKVALIAAFLTAVTPAFAYRTMAGAQGDNAFGFLWMVLGFIFFVKAVKTDSLEKKDWINVVLGGFFFGCMALSWNMYPLIPLIVVLYTLFALVLVATKDNSHNENLLKNHSAVLFIKSIVSLAIFGLMASLYGLDWISATFVWIAGPMNLSSEMAAILLAIALVVTLFFSVFIISQSNKEIKSMFLIFAIIALFLGFFVMLFFFVTEPDLFYRNGGRTSVGSMVGEESVGNQFFGTKYNSLIIFPWLALVLAPIGLWLFNKKDSHTTLIFFFWTIITLFMAWYKLKFSFVFGLGLIPGAAIVTYFLFEGLKKFKLEKGIESKVILGALFLLVVLGVGASARFFPDYVPYVDESPAWQEAQKWIVDNTPTDAKLFNWWDQGHILAFLTERKISTDNRNYSSAANKAMAEWIVTTDTNKAYFIASQQIGADYVLIEADMVSGAGTYEFYVQDKVDYSIITKKGYTNGIVRTINCEKDTNQLVINCSGNQIQRAEWDKLSTKWKSNPDDFYEGTEPTYYYRLGNSIIILNQALNNTNIAKALLNSDETKNYYEEAYNKNGIIILKIKK